MRRGAVVTAPAIRIALKYVGPLAATASIGDGGAEPAVLALFHLVTLAPVGVAGALLDVPELARLHLGALRLDIHCAFVSADWCSRIRGHTSKVAWEETHE